MLFDTPHLLQHISRRLLPALLLLVPAFAVAAETEQETRWYDVEVIIFSQKSQQFRQSEHWPSDIPLPEIQNARSLLPASGARTIAFSTLSGNRLRLGAEAARIKSAPELKLLKHFGWRQPGLEQGEAVSIKVLDDDGRNEGEPSRLEGTLKLVLSRYLHIHADLVYREPLPENAPMGMVSTNTEQMPRYQLYRLQQSRRMRSTELHYLDHPVLGMIIRVSPYEKPGT